MNPNKQISRRKLLQVGLVSGLGLSLADYLRLVQANPPQQNRSSADGVIFIHLAGGPAHLDTLDMKPDAPQAEQSEFSRINTRITGLSACEHLPRLAAAMNRFTLLRGISHTTGDHPRANQFLFSGNEPTPAVDYPAIGSVAARERPSRQDLPSFVAIPDCDAVPGFMGVQYAPFRTTSVPRAGQPFEMRGLSLGSNLTVDRIRNRSALLSDLDTLTRDVESSNEVVQGLDRFGQQAMAMILSPRAREAFDVSREPEAIRQLFANDDFSQSCLLAMRLIESGIRFVTVTHGGWDTHLDNFQNLRNRLLPPFDAGITALVEAMRQKGLLQRNLVVATGEFGRTPSINRNGGRDHWPRTMWTLMTGGGVQTGQLIGGTDRNGHGPDDDTDMKPDDLAASILHTLNIDHRHEYHTRNGRPVVLIQRGRVIRDLFA